MKRARILIADDHEFVRRGLRATILEQPGWDVCGEASSGRDAVDLTRREHPDIVVLDFAMPDLNGLEAARQIHEEMPESQVLMLTMHETEGLVREALAAGVRGFILKSDAGRLLSEAIQALLDDKTYFTGKVSQLILSGYLNPNARAPDEIISSRLSAREREVVQLVAEGRSSKEVAERLGISPKTAETHRTNIMRKLNLHSVTELVRFAIRNKIIEP